MTTTDDVEMGGMGTSTNPLGSTELGGSSNGSSRAIAADSASTSAERTSSAARRPTGEPVVSPTPRGSDARESQEGEVPQEQRKSMLYDGEKLCHYRPYGPYIVAFLVVFAVASAIFFPVYYVAAKD
mmetsp:Transcript_2452/g.4098  ORF Transcript_2452/g.4098 Transcript_2452/m.4098 type:complete len:127 (+) Transcript_2452:113-493(+)|eukprot:CAMPEP_0205914040 /NCGR_PEP_ID=MMETSP1325-20131115/6966_1 /ASSEMBLY_ACC=CAM_ASM_000708 /TAXON_ID=236786 /ORGANISM="Florenciella sp., Strain RCC1007" /LENGTH=126 /DNA_ID=CAMNT_0053281039 /DNA_START=106 /DNA_END=486 /DNA_ORIENTATION=+